MMTQTMNALPQADNIDVAILGKPRSIPRIWASRQSYAGGYTIVRMPPTGNGRRDTCP